MCIIKQLQVISNVSFIIKMRITYYVYQFFYTLESNIKVICNKIELSISNKQI